MIIKNSEQLREVFRGWLTSRGCRGAYTKREYKKFIKVHTKTLTKYLNGFNCQYKLAYGREFKKIIPSIRDVYKLYCCDKKKILRQFQLYLKYKTHFSYDLFYNPEPLRIKPIKKDVYIKRLDDMIETEKTSNQNKLGEFVILILSEYIILHNWMWASGLKLKGIKTIDKFHKNIIL